MHSRGSNVTTAAVQGEETGNETHPETAGIPQIDAATEDINSLLLTPEVAADRLGVSIFLLRKDRKTRHLGIPFVRVGKRLVRYRPTDLDAWLEQQAKGE